MANDPTRHGSVSMKRLVFLVGPVALLAIAEACGRTETSLGAQYGSDAAIGFGGGAGLAGSAGVASGGGAGMAGSGGSAGLIEDAGPEADTSEEDSGDASDGGEDADADATDAADSGCIVNVPDPTTTGVEGPSCAGGLTCAGTSCCESLLIPGGPYEMGRSSAGTDAYPAGAANEQPEHTVSVSPFYLDRFEVTVGRFRKFVATYTGVPPADGAGAHPLIAGTGWQPAWSAQLPATQAALQTALVCDPGLSTWTNLPGPNESMPVNCMSWYLAFAFCAWDGGRLATEAEWEKVAAGADENRLYPWGSTPPESCHGGFGGISPHANVGIHPAGAGRWGHQDLGGGEWEWVLDFWSASWYAGGGCTDCANLTSSSWRTIRSGAWSTFEGDRLRSAFRSFVQPAQILSNVSIRCAR